MKTLVAYALVFVVCFGFCAVPSAGDDDWGQPAQLPAPPPPPPTGGGSSVTTDDTSVYAGDEIVGALSRVVSANVYVQIALESLIQ